MVFAVKRQKPHIVRSGEAENDLVKHGISCEVATSGLLDPMALAFEHRNAEGESRWDLLGMSSRTHLLTVVYG
jgi:uncharacterized DUF497 family protein